MRNNFKGWNAINIVPCLPSMIIRMRVVITKIQILQRIWYGQPFTVWGRPHCSWKIWIFNCVFGIGGDPCYVCEAKVPLAVWCSATRADLVSCPNISVPVLACSLAVCDWAHISAVFDMTNFSCTHYV